jgi:hypothetical protein
MVEILCMLSSTAHLGSSFPSRVPRSSDYLIIQIIPPLWLHMEG